EAVGSPNPTSAVAVTDHLHAVTDIVKFGCKVFNSEMVGPRDVYAIEFAVGFAFVDPQLAILIFVVGQPFTQVVDRCDRRERHLASTAQSQDQSAKLSVVSAQTVAQPFLLNSGHFNRVINGWRILERVAVLVAAFRELHHILAECRGLKHAAVFEYVLGAKVAAIAVRIVDSHLAGELVDAVSPGGDPNIKIAVLEQIKDRVRADVSRRDLGLLGGGSSL